MTVAHYTPLYTPKQIGKIEKSWFDASHDSFGLMQQAAWQMASWLQSNLHQLRVYPSHIAVGPSRPKTDWRQIGQHTEYPNNIPAELIPINSFKPVAQTTACVWVGAGNNGGDGWLLAGYLQKMGASVLVIEVGVANTPDSKQAQAQAQQQPLNVLPFRTLAENVSITEATHRGNSKHAKRVDNTEDTRTINGSEQGSQKTLEDALQQFYQADVFIDALFGIGLDRAPTGDYQLAISLINQYAYQSQETPIKQAHSALIVAVDVPSGVQSKTGTVFDAGAVKADITLCLLARKVGLHIKDGQDYTGTVVDLPLIPTVLDMRAVALLQYEPNRLPARQNNTRKGSFGNVLIIGGNQVDGSQGMGGATMLASSTALASGVGKLTVACHSAFHGSVLAKLPNAMTTNLHDTEGVIQLIKDADAVAIGMGFGRDKASESLFLIYIQAIMEAKKDVVIDADGLYHLAKLTLDDDSKNSNDSKDNAKTLENQDCYQSLPKNTLVQQLKDYADAHLIYYTPHSAEAGRLLDVSPDAIEADRLLAIQTLQDRFGGVWLLKGTGSLVVENGNTYVCGAGNSGMATAGMGDALSGLCVSLLGQSALPKACRTLTQAVMIHAKAGDYLAQQYGEWAVQAQDMAEAIGTVMHAMTQAPYPH